MVFSLFVTAWGIGISWMLNNETTYEIAFASAQISHFCSLLITASWLHFVCAYLEIVERKILIIKSVYLFSFIVGCLAYSKLFIPNLKSIVGFKYYANPGPIYYIYTTEFVAVVAYGFSELIRSWRNQTGDSKKQLSSFIVATLIGFFFGCLMFFPVYGIKLPQYNVFLMPLYPFIMAYAIIRHRFLDSDEVLAIHRDKLALIGLMSSSINHEIKNPLFLLQELTRKLRDGNNEKTLDKMSSQIERMTKLVTRLSEFGKPSSNVGASEEVDLKQTIEDALYFASQELKYHNIDVKLDFNQSLPKLVGNKSQFEEIFLNLIVNAYHAMPNGGMLTITCSAKSDEIVITISDTGTGIPKDQLKNIFKPFYTTKEKSGTGLGLYIVKTLAEQNKGKIEVESKLNRGTTFRLIFPC